MSDSHTSDDAGLNRLRQSVVVGERQLRSSKADVFYNVEQLQSQAPVSPLPGSDDDDTVFEKDPRQGVTTNTSQAAGGLCSRTNVGRIYHSRPFLRATASTGRYC